MSKELIEALIITLGVIASFLIAPILFQILCAIWTREIDFINFLFAKKEMAPVRHASWNIRLADESTLCLECSACGRRVDNIDLHYLLEAGEYGEVRRRYPYCHCGRKMDLEEKTP